MIVYQDPPRSVAIEVFYVVLAETEDGTREVLGILNMSQERATVCGDIFDRLKNRGLHRIGLMVADGIKGIDTIIWKKFPETPLQRCVTHLKRKKYDMGTRPIFQPICWIFSALDNATT